MFWSHPYRVKKQNSIWNENMWSRITVADLLPCLEDFTVSLVNSDYLFCTIYSWLIIGIERKRCNKVNVCTEHSSIWFPTFDSYLHFWWTWHENKHQFCGNQFEMLQLLSSWPVCKMQFSVLTLPGNFELEILMFWREKILIKLPLFAIFHFDLL